MYNFHGTPQWFPAIVNKQTGSVTFLVELEDKRQVRRHQDHIRYRASTDNTVIVGNQSSDDIDDFLPILPCVNDPVDAQSTVPLRRSHRIRRPLIVSLKGEDCSDVTLTPMRTHDCTYRLSCNT